MKIAIIGLAQSGKSSLFHALTGGEPGRDKGGFTMGTVQVPDARVDRLSAVYQPKKTTYANVELVDTMPPQAKATGGAGFDGSFLAAVRPMDAFLLVLRAFDEPGLCEPAVDAATMLSEMAVADLMVVDGRLERMAQDGKKGKPVSAEERVALERASALLNAGKAVRDDPEVAALPELRTYALLTARPILLVLNVGETDTGVEHDALCAQWGVAELGLPTFGCNAKLEAEIRDLPEADRAEFMGAMNIRESAVHAMIRKTYGALGLVSFLTGGDDEVRAWTIHRGTLAPRAAGAVHSDIEKGFIRAEVIAYDDFDHLGSEAAARKAGRYRLEGREYVVQDGDIINFRFNV